MKHRVLEVGQPYELINALNKEDKVTHNAEAVGNISHVRLAQDTPAALDEPMHVLTVAQLRFCTVKTRFNRFKTKGDGNPIPTNLDVVIVGFDQIPTESLPKKAGLYRMENVGICPNGTCVIKCDANTRFVSEKEATDTIRNQNERARVHA